MVRRLPPLNALRAFEAAARLGSFTAAAEELAVTPAAVSHQVKGLEDYLGLPLFERLARGIRLTDAGRAYLPQLTFGFNHLARASAALSAGEARGVLTVSVLPSLLRRWLLPRLGDFRRRHPGVSLRFGMTSVYARFSEGEADIGLRYGSGEYPGLQTVRLLDEVVFPVASPSLATGPQALRQWPDMRRANLIHQFVTSVPDPWIQWRPWLLAHDLPEVDTESGLAFDDASAAMQAAQDGLGVALGRGVLVADDVRSGRLVPLFDELRRADFAYWIVGPRASFDLPKVAVFVDWLREMAEATPSADAIL